MLSPTLLAALADLQPPLLCQRASLLLASQDFSRSRRLMFRIEDQRHQWPVGTLQKILTALTQAKVLIEVRSSPRARTVRLDSEYLASPGTLAKWQAGLAAAETRAGLVTSAAAATVTSPATSSTSSSCSQRQP